MPDNIRPPWAQDLANDLAQIRTQIQDLAEENRQEIAALTRGDGRANRRNFPGKR